MAIQEQSVEHLFVAAADLSPATRSAFLDYACAGKPEVRQLVEDLLRDSDLAGSFLEKPLLNPARHSRFGGELSASNSACVRAALDPASRFQPGDLVADRFEIVRFIARGGMGEVYEVQDTFLQDTRVALKVIRSEIAADAASSHRFQQEVILARKVTHPNLCPIYEIFRCEDPAPPFLFLTMKLIEGETLEQCLRRSHQIPREEAFEISHQLIAGVAAIHAAGVIHRDLKPNNIMLERSGDRLCVYITDFGLARLYEAEATVLKTGMIAGTPGYLAPELMRGQRPTQATDIFALGVVLHRLLTGERPVEGDDGFSVTPAPALHGSHLPADLVRRVEDFLSSDPERRCRAFDELSHVQNQRHAYAVMNPRLLSRRSFIVGAGATTLAVAGGAFWQRDRIYDAMHPLPRKRFVALLNWPPSSDPGVKPMVNGLIDAISKELVRAEAFDRDFLVIAQNSAADPKNEKQLMDLRESLGANLVLAASGVVKDKRLQVFLQVLDPASSQSLRHKEIRSLVDQQFSLPEQAVRAAAELLDLANFQPDNRRTEIGTDNPDALRAFQAAEAHAKEPNIAHLDQAVEEYKAAIEADPRFALAHAQLALAYVRLYSAHGDSSAITLARGNAETAIALNPQSVESHLALGTVYQEVGDTAGALHEFGQALSMDPANPRAISYQAILLRLANRLPESEAASKRVLHLRPNYWPGYNGLGNTYFAEGKLQLALEAYRSASMLAPHNPLPLSNLASVYLALGNNDQALNAIDKSIALSPTYYAYQTRADILRVQGRDADSLQASLKAAQLNPADGLNWLETGDAYSRLRKEKDADTAYGKGAEALIERLRMDPKDGSAWMLLALCQSKMGRQSDATEALKRAEELGAVDNVSQMYKVRLLVVLGRQNEALDALASCVKRGVTKFQIAATPDLEALRKNPAFANLSDHTDPFLSLLTISH